MMIVDVLTSIHIKEMLMTAMHLCGIN